MNLKKNKQDERYNYRMNKKGHHFLLGSRILKTESSNLFDESPNFPQKIKDCLKKRGIVNINISILESNSSFCWDMWASSEDKNADDLVGKVFCLRLCNSYRVLRHGLFFARRADWEIDGIRGNLISIGYFHGNKYDNIPSYELDGYEKRYASEYARHDLVLKIISVS